jgi:ABC-2 type transport system ATP-binding protein
MTPGPAAEPVIQARGLRRLFGKVEAVRGVDLQVNAGEVFGFLGPNGAGKSTLIRMLTGLLPPSAGEVKVLGLDIPKQAEALKPLVGYMTQRFSLYEDLTVAENLHFAAQIFALSGKQRRERIQAAFEDYGLSERAKQRAGSLSGGWKQRLALAVATLHRPQLLILDEPTAGVDPERRRAFWEKLFELAAGGVSILVSTHYMDEAVRCHRLAMVVDGRVVGLGSPRELVAELQGRVLELASPDPEPAIAMLRQMADVASVTQLGNRVHLLLRESAVDSAGCLERLQQALTRLGGGDHQLTPCEATLEDVFVALNDRAEPC